MTLPLPFVISDAHEAGIQADDIQGNFDALKKSFPLTRKHMKIETPHIVGDSGEPAFQNSWVNFDTSTFRGARFWKDPMGIVHIEGLVKSGTVGTTIFTLPAGYRPGNGLMFPSITNSGVGRVDVAATGNVVHNSGGNTYFSINLSFKQEQ